MKAGLPNAPYAIAKVRLGPTADWQAAGQAFDGLGPGEGADTPCLMRPGTCMLMGQRDRENRARVECPRQVAA